mmetsp:Transcript_5698/g.7966  ORF Transcript_5698/g.7966 Transcript_5698/m.7966 type:complete len:125 (-) Transcript_5698:55-429(-)|eukprot:CAMPEP_0168555580 /NCGR_PEP_ID=MMETSP0413-20121227/8415_1 /TAXON_ID=136452 /ORGANISM="Filamoeba nolandi, Strain NC-AS-23-1" /LENGTH=124 /DNA_ID=CAMNT_0008586449 /DNA_START=78 /DNA_END=452 /DNA_ORIENTATION=+
MANFEEIGKAFINHYYSLFDANKRGELGALYQANSMLTFEDGKFQGPENIVNKLNSLTFQTVKHGITTIDAQPSPGNGILVFVTGNLVVDNEQNIIKFSQVFNLMPLPNGGYYVFNDLFRLNYA